MCLECIPLQLWPGIGIACDILVTTSMVLLVGALASPLDIAHPNLASPGFERCLIQENAAENLCCLGFYHRDRPTDDTVAGAAARASNTGSVHGQRVHVVSLIGNSR